MNLIFHELFKFDLEQAVNFLREQESGLEVSFLDDADQTIQRINDNPTAWSRINGEIRNILLDTFRYSMHFEIINEDTIFIYGIYHTSRHPDFGKQRRSG